MFVCLDLFREAEALLKELVACTATPWDPKLRVYKAWSLMFTRQKASIEQAATRLGEAVQQQTTDAGRESVPLLLAMSQQLILQKQVRACACVCVCKYVRSFHESL